MFSLVPRCHGTLRVAEVDVHISRDRKRPVRGQFTAAVPRQRGHQARGKRAHRPRERTDDADGVFPRQPDEEDDAGSPLDQGRDVRVSGARQQVALPVPRHGPVRRLRRTLADGHRINDAPRALVRPSWPASPGASAAAGGDG